MQMETSVIQEKQHKMDARKTGLCGRRVKGNKVGGIKDCSLWPPTELIPNITRN